MKRIILFRKALTVEGGAERLMLEIADQFTKKGVETHVVALRGKDMREFFGGDYAHINVTIFQEGDYPESFFGKVVTSLSGLARLRRHIKKTRPDILLGQNPADAEMLYFANLGTGRPYATFIHGSLFCFPDETLKYTTAFRGVFDEIWNNTVGHETFIPRKPSGWNILARVVDEIRAWISYASVRRARVVFSLSECMAWENEKLYKRDVVALKCGIEKEVFGYRPTRDIKEKYGIGGKKMILDVSRLIPGKRLDVAIRTFSFLAHAEPDIYFVIGGRGPEKENLERIISELGLEDRVIMAGFVPEEELLDHYASCDVVLHPAWIDFDITVMEALALGKKVVCSTEYDISGNLKKLEGSHLFPADPDPEALADALRRALAASPLPREKREGILSEYTWESYAEKLLSYLPHE